LAYIWRCSDLKTNDDCKSILGDPISLNSQISNTFEAKLFEPYSTFLFSLEGQANSKSKTAFIILIVVELDLPPLKVSMPEYAVISKINKNDDLQLDIEFDKNPDDYFFAVVLLYNLEIVATKRQSYTSFTVKIWDLYNEFSRDQPDVLLRVTFYDPNYFTPSYSS
jgi:hypothetical protein